MNWDDYRYFLAVARSGKLSEAGRLSEAEAAFRRAIDLDPDSAPAYRNLGNQLAPQGRGAVPGNCKSSDYKSEGNKVTWSMRCEGENPMTGTGEFVYSGDTYTGTMKMTSGRGGQPMTMTMTYSGKRLGDCTKSTRNSPAAQPV